MDMPAADTLPCLTDPTAVQADRSAADRPRTPPAALEPLLLTAEDLAQLLRISPATVWRLRAAGKLPRPLDALGRQLVRWRAEEIRRWVDAGLPDMRTWEALRDQAARRNGR
jgi:predicted DNA-binding transcriptional regulator AlpA